MDETIARTLLAIFGLIGTLIVLAILYYVIRVAVHHGIRDAQRTVEEQPPRVAGPREERSLNTR